MAEVLPITSPDAEAMRKHVQHLFWYEFRDGEYDGLIELAWTDAADHKLRHARLFGLDEIELLLEEAVRINSVPQQNVYLGAALRAPDTARQQRAADKDFYSLKCVYADLDEKGAATAATGRFNGIRPTLVIITGTDPHYRAHLYFRLEKPIRDPQEVRETLGLTAENFNGDPAVTNPGRVMRLGGSIAWPIKKGRQIEMTEVVTFDDGRAEELPVTALQAAWKAPALTDWDVGGGNGIDADSCISEIRNGRNLHINTRNLVAKRVGQGVRDKQIVEEVEALLRPVSDGGTLSQVGKFIESARVKYSMREPEPVVTNLIIARDWQGIDPLPREWVVEGWIPKGHVTGFYGNGGIGKTLLAQQLLTSVASGDPWLNMEVEQSKAFGFFCEDYENDIHITQQAICREYGLTMRSLSDLAFMSRVGEDNILMTFDKSGVGVLTPLFYELLTAIKDYGARFVVIDTLADTFGGEENNRPQARQFVANCLGRLAREIGGTAMVCAHPSIAGMQSGEGYGGSTAWNNTFRSRIYLSRPDDDHDDPDLRTLERKKANYASTGEPMMLRWADGVLGLADAGTSGGFGDQMSMDTARQILTEIDAKWRDERPYAMAKNTGKRYAVRMMQQRFKLRKGEAENTLHNWWQNGVVGEDIVSKKTKMKGLKVTKWL